jgi:Cu/Ag efflux protein CusF
MKHSSIRRLSRIVVLAGLLGLAVNGCQPPADSPADPPATPPPQQSGAPQIQEYKLDGEIVSVDKDKKSAVIKHEEIQGFMAAMTMSYPIPEQADLDKIKAGDRITATVYDQRAESKMWLGNIQVTNTPNP